MRPMTPDGAETISISIGLGGDARASSSIVLPRGHDLVRHLERLLPQLAKTAASSSSAALSPLAPDAHHYSPRQTHPLYPHRHHHSPTAQPLYSPSAAHRHHPYQQPHPRSRSLYAEAPHSPYLSDASSNDSFGPASSTSSSIYEGMATTQAHHLQPLPTHHQLQQLQQQQQQFANTRRRRGPAGTQGAGKKCQFPECEKISVSRGLCRGHGGGRRCQRPGCGKGAQSRSDFCWAHGGGQRCEVKNCMRSRKSKRFCVAHLSWESAPSSELLDASAASRAFEHPKTIMPKPLVPYAEAYASTTGSPGLSPTALSLPALANASKLPSLQQALRKNQCVAASTSSASVTSSPFASAGVVVLNG